MSIPTDDRTVVNPLNTGIQPVSGATDFSVDPGTLKPFGDVRVSIVDYHTSKPVYYFKKPQTKLPSGALTLDFSKYALAQPIWQPLITLDVVPPTDERGGTVSVEAQQIDGIDREQRLPSLVWPAAFNDQDDLDAYFTYYRRRCVFNNALSAIASEFGTIDSGAGTITYDLSLVYGVDLTQAPFVYNLSDLPIPVNAFGSIYDIDHTGKTNLASSVSFFADYGGSPYPGVFSSNAEQGPALEIPAAWAGLMYPQPVLDDTDHPPTVIVTGPGAPQTIRADGTYTSPVDGSQIMVPCVLSAIHLMPFVRTEPTSDVGQIFISIMSEVLTVNGGPRDLSNVNGLNSAYLTEPIYGTAVYQLSGELTIGDGPAAFLGGEALYPNVQFPSIAMVYATYRAANPTYPEDEVRLFAKNYGYPFAIMKGVYPTSFFITCTVDDPNDSTEYIMGRVLAFGVDGAMNFPQHYCYPDLNFSTDIRSRPTIDSPYITNWPSRGSVGYGVTNESALSAAFTYDIVEVPL